MPLDFARNLDAPPLRPDRLAAGDAVSLPPTRRQVRALRCIVHAFWLAMAAAVAVRVIVSLSIGGN